MYVTALLCLIFVIVVAILKLERYTSYGEHNIRSKHVHVYRGMLTYMGTPFHL